jgi:hypothetical protein
MEAPSSYDSERGAPKFESGTQYSIVNVHEKAFDTVLRAGEL